MTDQPCRLPDGGRIDRTKPHSFSFDGRRYAGYAGDTLAAALLANGVSLVARSFKYHRARGIYSAGIEEPNALFTLKSGERVVPNVRGTGVELYDGLVATSQNRWPSLRLDVMSAVGLFPKLFAAGFYYKTFMGPTRKAWLLYEHFIREAAGMGAAATTPDPAHYEKAEAFCDVLVVGAGPSGLMAALSAGRSGARVILVEDDFELGGSLLTRSPGGQSDQWLGSVAAELESMANVRVMKRTCAFGAYDNLVFGLVERINEHRSDPAPFEPWQRYWIVRARRAVLATGMIERPIVFGNNDLPGVMLASAARTYANRFAVRVGRKIAVFTNNNSAYSSAIALVGAGSDVTVIDSRQEVDTGLVQAARGAGVTLHCGHAVARANGGQRVRSVDVTDYQDEDTQSQPQRTRLRQPQKTRFGHTKTTMFRQPQRSRFRLSCDALLVSGGWTPTLHLLSQRGPKPVYDEKRAMFVAGEVPEGFLLAGAAACDLGLRAGVRSGERAGTAAAEQCGFAPPSTSLGPVPALPDNETGHSTEAEPDRATEDETDLAAEDELDLATQAIWEVPDTRLSKSAMKFVDIQNDVKSDDIGLAHREGYDSVELLKRYTTLGMATDQGKTANLNAMAIMAGLHRTDIKDVGTTMFRPPYRPVLVGAMAGQTKHEHFRPTRRSPMHDWHERNGAVFAQTNLWVRPWYFPQPGESVRSASIREAAAVRERVGMTDVSSLGKIDVQGPDVAEFLNRVYVNHFDTLKPGKVRYGMMLRLDGIALDDGTTARISENDYFMTTTTAGEATVLTHLEYLLQTAWPDLEVQLTSVTSQWAGIAVAGPRCRSVLANIIHDIDFSNEALPFMGVDHGHLDGIPVRVSRLSFSGEMAYEVYVPAGYGEHVWQAIFDAGQAFGIIPYGTEALNILRTEKGHVAGPELDGRTNLIDLGMGRMASRKKPFVGSAMLQREGMADPARPQLVGLKPVKDGDEFRAGAILCEQGQHGGHGLGRVSSIAYSPELAMHIGLGFVSGGMSRRGDVIDAVFPLRKEVTAVRVVSPHFVDPKGERLRV